MKMLRVKLDYGWSDVLDRHEVWDAVELHVSQHRNRLRTLSHSELLRLPDAFIETAKFRSLTVVLATVKPLFRYGRVLVLGRGHVTPFAESGIVAYFGFLKDRDDSWKHADMYSIGYRLMALRCDFMFPYSRVWWRCWRKPTY